MSEPASKRGLPTRVKMRHGAHFVDELTRRHETPIGRMVPLSALEPNPDQPRNSVGDLSDLVESIKAKGILEPILVRPRKTAEEGESELARSQFQIISGERRYRAALEAGLFDVPVIEMAVSDQEALEIALIENLQRKDLSPFEEADGYRALAELYSYKHEQIASAVGKSRTSVTESLMLLQLPARVREAAHALGITTKSTLLEVLKAGDENQMIQLLERVATQGLSRDDVRREQRAISKAGDPPRRKPYIFKFKAPDRSFQLAVTFRQSTVDSSDLIRALEQILADLRSKANPTTKPK
ncbi:MAG: ParB/RepB/Spo0J family partition protein [Holophagales bacterium]|nr:MAG: ParB/RepB/Spo0J family partition protein [Holophagales bacterium]